MGIFSQNFIERKSGLLVPFRAMPGDDDYQGTLGLESTRLLEVMNRAGFGVLHDLPNTPPDVFGCPYSSVSAFAIDPQRIDLESLAKVGDISSNELTVYQELVSSQDAGHTIKSDKEELLWRAYANFDNFGSPERKELFTKWCEQEAEWLDSYAAFEILKNLPQNLGKRWENWEAGKYFNPSLIADLKTKYRQHFSAICYTQWVAEEQTLQYLKYARHLGIEVWGDVPFYTGDAEVWANPGIFNLDSEGKQLSQGGAPPSDTSITGQRWGNPTYKIDPENNPLDTKKAIDWWVKRLKRAYKLSAGKVRLDHFIGFAEPYILAADASDGQNGWRETGMGSLLFDRLVKEFGEDLPFCPEDLGEMTDKTPDLRDKYKMQTTKVAVRGLTKHLLKGIGVYLESPNNPDNYTNNTVAFSSTHDSPTLRQALIDVWQQISKEEFSRYVGYLDKQYPHKHLDALSSFDVLSAIEIDRVIRSMAGVAFLGAWDILSLGKEARYNIPGRVAKANWAWRMNADQMRLLQRQAPMWRELNNSSGRLPSEAS